MAKKKKIENKEEALLCATLHLVNNRGFHDASMAKIAKLAGVAPGTIYLYFKSKQDLINKLYLRTKETFCKHAFDDYHTNDCIKNRFKNIWINIAEYKLSNTDDAMFLFLCDISPLVDEEIRQEGLKHLQPLLDLWKDGIKEKVIKDVSPFLLYSFTINPLSFLVSMHHKNLLKIEKKEIEEAFQLSWDSIKIK